MRKAVVQKKRMLPCFDLESSDDDSPNSRNCSPFGKQSTSTPALVRAETKERVKKKRIVLPSFDLDDSDSSDEPDQDIHSPQRAWIERSRRQTNETVTGGERVDITEEGCYRVTCRQTDDAPQEITAISGKDYQGKHTGHEDEDMCEMCNQLFPIDQLPQHVEDELALLETKRSGSKALKRIGDARREGRGEREGTVGHGHAQTSAPREPPTHTHVPEKANHIKSATFYSETPLPLRHTPTPAQHLKPPPVPTTSTSSLATQKRDTVKDFAHKTEFKNSAVEHQKMGGREERGGLGRGKPIKLKWSNMWSSVSKGKDFKGCSTSAPRSKMHSTTNLERSSLNPQATPDEKCGGSDGGRWGCKRGGESGGEKSCGVRHLASLMYTDEIENVSAAGSRRDTGDKVRNYMMNLLASEGESKSDRNLRQVKPNAPDKSARPCKVMVLMTKEGLPTKKLLPPTPSLACIGTSSSFQDTLPDIEGTWGAQVPDLFFFC